MVPWKRIRVEVAALMGLFDGLALVGHCFQDHRSSFSKNVCKTRYRDPVKGNKLHTQSEQQTQPPVPEKSLRGRIEAFQVA